jgi:hypothetical protein
MDSSSGREFSAFAGHALWDESAECQGDEPAIVAEVVVAY